MLSSAPRATSSGRYGCAHPDFVDGPAQNPHSRLSHQPAGMHAPLAIKREKNYTQERINQEKTTTKIHCFENLKHRCMSAGCTSQSEKQHVWFRGGAKGVGGRGAARVP